jgi:hypothetical protein
MQPTVAAPSPRDEVLRRIGRNVVNFQYLEATLRSMIPLLENEGTLKDWQSNLSAKTRRHKKSSLGDLAGTFLESISSGAEESLVDADEPLRELKLRVTFQVDTTPEQEAEQRTSLLKLVRERNRLIHRDALDVDLNSPEQCARLAAWLDEQNERIREQLLHLNLLRTAHREALEEFVRFMQTEEFLSVLQGQGRPTFRLEP